jgi:hypothetical protein
MLNIIPVEPVDVPKFEAKLVGVVQFQPFTDKSTEPSNALALLASTTIAEAETSQYKHDAVSLIVAKEL